MGAKPSRQHDFRAVVEKKKKNWKSNALLTGESCLLINAAHSVFLFVFFEKRERKQVRKKVFTFVFERERDFGEERSWRREAGQERERERERSVRARVCVEVEKRRERKRKWETKGKEPVSFEVFLFFVFCFFIFFVFETTGLS